MNINIIKRQKKINNNHLNQQKIIYSTQLGTN
jgi:hypothetical protein